MTFTRPLRFIRSVLGDYEVPSTINQGEGMKISQKKNGGVR